MKMEQRLNSLNSLYNRAIEVLASGNQIGAEYLSCVLGMWSECANITKNPFMNDNNILYNSWNTGFDASKIARNNKI